MNCIVKRVLLDRESAIEVMFYNILQQIGLLDTEIVLVTMPLVGFDKVSMVPLKSIKLAVATGDKLLMIEFVVVDVTSPYNIIMGKG